MDNLLETFCYVDDVCHTVNLILAHQEHLLPAKTRGPQAGLCHSEIVCILILFHQSNARHFKGFYTNYVKRHLRQEFPGLVSYSRFITLQKDVLLHMWCVVQGLLGEQTGITFIDSTSLDVCHIKREKQHKVFEGFAKKSKTTTGWFFGFKLHLCVNDKGELLSFWLTAANDSDLSCVEKLTQGLVGKIYGDKGYISQELTSKLAERGLNLITKLRKNMKPKMMKSYDALMLRKRALIESVIDQLKNISQIEHSRHRSTTNFMLNLLSGLAAYGLQPKKPSLDLHHLSDSDELIVL